MDECREENIVCLGGRRMEPKWADPDRLFELHFFALYTNAFVPSSEFEVNTSYFKEMKL